MAETESKKLSELRVVDLKHELEKRDIEPTGVKAILVKKLRKALMDEKLDPETHLFSFEVDGKGTPTKKKKDCLEEDSAKEVKEVESDETEEPGKANDTETTTSAGDSEKDAAQEEITKSEEKQMEADEDKESEKQNGSSEVQSEDKDGKDDDKELVNDEAKSSEECVKESDSLEKKDAEKEKSSDEAEKEDQAKEDEERDPLEELLEDKEDQEQDHEPEEEPEITDKTASKEIEEEDALKLEDKNDANGMIDAEDSIHLTIGEDEEKFMAGEDEPLDRNKDSKEERSGGRGCKMAEQRKSNIRISPDSTPDDKEKKSHHRNLWVSGLAAITRAQDLKQIFSKLGKVVAAKVVTNAKTPGARCYGFVTMATAEDAQACIKGLNLTELHGKLISVEAVANKPVSGNTKKPEEKRKASPLPQTDEKKPKREEKSQSSAGEKKADTSEKSISHEESKKKDEEGSRDRPKTANSDRSGRKSGSPTRRSRPPIRERLGERPVVHPRNRIRDTRPVRPSSSKRGDILSFAQIKEQYERRRQREKERESDRAIREEERRRREELERVRSIELHQKEEMMRLEREREKVRLERIKLQKEKQELIRIERERLEREKEDLRKAQLKLEEEKRSKRVAREVYEERKHSDSSRRYDPVGPPSRKEPRRDSSPPHVRRYDESSTRSRREEPSSSARMKETMRYSDKSSSSSLRSGRDDRREERRDRSREAPPLRKDSSRMHRDERFEPPPPPKADIRYGSESWTTGGSGKPYSSSSSRPDAAPWLPPDRKLGSNPWVRPTPSQSDRRERQSLPSSHERPRTPPSRSAQLMRTRKASPDMVHRAVKRPMTPPYPDARREHKMEHIPHRRPPSPPPIHQVDRYTKDDRRRPEVMKSSLRHVPSHSTHNRPSEDEVISSYRQMTPPSSPGRHNFSPKKGAQRRPISSGILGYL